MAGRDVGLHQWLLAARRDAEHCHIYFAQFMVGLGRVGNSGKVGKKSPGGWHDAFGHAAEMEMRTQQHDLVLHLYCILRSTPPHRP